MSRACICLLVLVGAFTVSGCSGARVGIVAEQIDAPVSLTSAIYDEHGGVLLEGRELEIVGQFNKKKVFGSVFWHLAPPAWTWDASLYLEDQIAKFGGEAITNFKANVTNPNVGGAFAQFFGVFIPVVPHFMEVEIWGNVVRRRPSPG